jgi:hypothetical protein
MSGPPANAPKPTKTGAQKFVQSIGSDKAKLQTYCDLDKLNQQIYAADEKKDTKTLQDLAPKAVALAEKLGPDYKKLIDQLDQADDNSAEFKEIAAAFNSLGKQCK